MLKAHLRLEGIKDGFDDEALAQHDLVSQGHQVVPHVPADTGNEVQAALPECLEQVLTDIAFVGVELAGQVPGHLIQHGAVGGVAGGDFQGQYPSIAFGKRCGEAGVRPSMGSVGDAYDNAMAESFFSTLEAELLSRRRFASQAEAKMACFSYIEGWYNPVRLHSGLGYRSPVTYEADMQAAMTKT